MANNTPADKELLEKYIETITHSGLTSLDCDLLTKVKGICRKTPCHLQDAYKHILKQMKKNHSEVRLSAFQLCAELFKRAHSFRLLVINNLEEILELTAEILPGKPLPPPKDAAHTLKRTAFLTIQQWKTDFGDSYKEFVICFNYLARCKNVDFNSLQQEISAAEAARIEREQQVLRARQQMFDDFLANFNEKLPEIETTIEAINNCISLLLPPPDEFFVADGGFVEDEINFTRDHTHEVENEGSFNLRQHGLSFSYNLVINIDHNKKVRIIRTEENSAIIDNLKESIKLAKKRFCSTVNKWTETLTNYSMDQNYNRRVQVVKDRLEKCLEKHKELRIEGIEEESSDDDDSEMEEVTKDGYEPAVMPILQESHPSSSKSCDRKINVGDSRGESVMEVETIHRICRAPLPSGRLCPRWDRFQCPSHGKIVPRDDSGRCIPPEDRARGASAAIANDSESDADESVPDWQDPVLLAQLKAATGIDLKMPEKKKKGKRIKKIRKKRVGGRRKGQPCSDVLQDIKMRNFPGITDINKKNNNPYTRLRKKIFNKSSLRRVANAIDKLQRRKHTDAFDKP